jgi:chaperonin GroEL (HSP60 family)
LEKLGDVTSAQLAEGSDSLGIDCDSGGVVDLWERGIIDPLPVKTNALQAAAELAQAILRIDTIIKKKEAGKRQDSAQRGDEF